MLGKKREMWTGLVRSLELKPCFEPRSTPTINDEDSNSTAVNFTTWQVDLMTPSHICSLRQQTHDALTIRKIQVS